MSGLDDILTSISMISSSRGGKRAFFLPALFKLRQTKNEKSVDRRYIFDYDDAKRWRSTFGVRFNGLAFEKRKRFDIDFVINTGLLHQNEEFVR